MMKRWIFSFLLLAAPMAHAGLFELGFSGNYRDSRIDSDNYQKMTSLTGSISYYFLELSALEISFTDGESETSIRAPGSQPIIYTRQFQMIGLDLVLALAGRKAAFQPFIKGGAAQITQKVFQELSNGQVDDISDPDDNKVVPTAGVGFKLRLTNTFSVKMSYDTWRSARTDDSETWDQSIRAGVSWLF